MALSGPGEFDSTMQAFAAHWGNVNATIAPNPPFVLAGGYTRDQFITDQSALLIASNEVVARENALSTAAGLLETRKRAIQPRVTQFNVVVRGLLRGSGFDNSLPKAPSVSASTVSFLRAMEDMRQLWTTINGVGNAVPDFTPPLQYGDGYILSTFAADLAALINQVKTYENAAKDAQVAREKRNVLLVPARARMVDYRRRLPARLTLGNPLVASMPLLAEKPGSTPDAPNLSAHWDAAQQKAVLTWIASPSPNITSYAVRVCAGKTYRAKDESAVLSVGGDVLSAETAAGLVSAGDVASFKVYAVSATGNARGSLAVSVTRA